MTARYKIVDVPLQPMTAEAFAPYGRLIESRPVEGHGAEGKFRMTGLPFTVDGTPDLRIAHYPAQDMYWSKFERHLTMTETRIALGRAVVLIVAGDTPLDERCTLPDVRSVKALLMRGDQGIVFRRGAWHGLDCYPVNTRHADFAFLTEREAEDELVDLGNVDTLRRSHIVDFAETRNIVFRASDPCGLARSIPVT